MVMNVELAVKNHVFAKKIEAKKEEAKASTQLKRLEKDTNELYQALIKPKGLRLRLLKWLYPEITKVANSLRRCYWSN